MSAGPLVQLTVDRVLDAVSALERSGARVTHAAVAAASGLSVPTVFRYRSTLRREAMGIKQEHQHRTYRILSHGLSYTTEYRAWQTMRQRCTIPTNQAYPSYGGRGITVCARWIESPANFMEDMGKKPDPSFELDRIDNDSGYHCGKCEDCHARGVIVTNCRWTTRSVNDRNRRNNRFLTHNGETLTVTEWCERVGLPNDTFLKRLDNGWGVARALTTPLMRRGPTRGAKANRQATKEAA